jgi:hypothetical protein
MKTFISYFSLWLVSVIFNLAIVSLSFACTGMLVNEYVQTMERICVYKHLNETVTRVVSRSSVCPVYIQVDH